MFEREVGFNRFQLKHLGTIIDSMTDAEFSERPLDAGHSPLWILGHLAVSADSGLQTLGLPAAAPKHWHALFGPGSSDDVPNSDQFNRQKLHDIVRQGYERLHEAALRSTPGEYDRPHGIPFLESLGLSTISDLLCLLLTIHFSLHLGQLSYWNRLQGRKPIF